jgi:hypothetical protein
MLRGTFSRVADFKNLVAWQKSHKVSIATIAAAESIHGNAGTLIRNQLIRSMLSIQSISQRAAQNEVIANLLAASASHSARLPRLKTI